MRYAKDQMYSHFVKDLSLEDEDSSSMFQTKPVLENKKEIFQIFCAFAYMKSRHVKETV